MFQLRIHGRGGQGVVTAAELVSVAAFMEGRHAQAFPSFGSERTGAPVVAFCRIELNRAMQATICCAGHPMPMVMRGSGSIEHVGRPGSVLGWVDDPKLLDVEFEIEPRESLVLFTDGVTEARAPARVIEPEELHDALRAIAPGSAQRIVEHLAALAVGKEGTPPRDDIALLALRARE